MSVDRRAFWKDESGSTFVEFTVVVFTFLMLLGGVVEFSYAYFQWNAATKAVQQGARIAAVSDPVSSGLTTIDGLKETDQPEDQLAPGDGIPAGAYRITCEWAAGDEGGTCECNGGAYCPDAEAEDFIEENFNRIVCGYNGCEETDPPCPAAVDGAGTRDSRRLGMCHFFPRIRGSNVRVVYEFTGLGYAGRPGGPVPTIMVELKDMTFDFLLLRPFLGNSINLPSFATTVTGEDLNAAGSAG